MNVHWGNSTKESEGKPEQECDEHRSFIHSANECIRHSRIILSQTTLRDLNIVYLLRKTTTLSYKAFKLS
jgi:hypothetical protein